MFGVTMEIPPAGRRASKDVEWVFVADVLLDTLLLPLLDCFVEPEFVALAESEEGAGVIVLSPDLLLPVDLGALV
jgi:hypothetical protein